MDLVDEILGAMGDAQDDPAVPHRIAPDRVVGMLLGGALGDALGAPHEFRNQVPLVEYTGAVIHPLTVVRRFQGGRLYGSLGQVSDDTEMTIALARSLTSRGPARYDESAAIAYYLDWANSKCPFLGNNTRALFVGVRTEAGYRRRHAAQFAAPREQWSQSNGCLMRCAPLATLADWRSAAETDTALTNPHPICVDAVRAYVGAMRSLLEGGSPGEATAHARRLAETPEVRDTLRQADEQQTTLSFAAKQRARDVNDHRKGWVLHAFYCAFLALNSPASAYQDRVDAVVRLGGDTDTNAAIAGSMLGASLGRAAMAAEPRTGPNLDILLGVDPTAGELHRPRVYGARNIPAIAETLSG